MGMQMRGHMWQSNVQIQEKPTWISNFMQPLISFVILGPSDQTSIIYILSLCSTLTMDLYKLPPTLLVLALLEIVLDKASLLIAFPVNFHN